MNLFFKENQKQSKNYKLQVTKAFTERVKVKDEHGREKEVEQPISWEFRVLSSEFCDQLREDYQKEIEVVDKKKGIKTYRTKFDATGYMTRLVVESCVYPDLKDSKLQESYGVYGAVDLLYALVPNPGEFAQLLADVNKNLGYTDLPEDIETAKN